MHPSSRPIRRGPRLPRRMHARPAGRRHHRRGAPRPRALGGRRPPAAEYSAAVERARGHAATLLGTGPDRIATGSQVSVFAGPRRGISARRRRGGLHRGRLLVGGRARSSRAATCACARCRSTRLADAIGPGDVAGVVLARAVRDGRGRRCGIRRRGCQGRRRTHRSSTPRRPPAGCRPPGSTPTSRSATPTSGSCAPRGAAFAAVLSDRADRRVRAVHGRMVLGRRPRASCYGPDLHLAEGARRFEVSPAWHAWVGAEAALGFAASLDMDDVRRPRCRRSRTRSASELGHRAPSDSAIVTWPDADGSDLAALTAAGVVASGRAGRARVAFHLWNDEEDVALAADALGLGARRARRRESTSDARRKVDLRHLDSRWRVGRWPRLSRLRGPCSTGCRGPRP